MDSTGSKSSNKTLLWIAGGCIAILVCGVAIFLSGFGGLYWLGSQVAEEVTVSWDVPVDMNVDETFGFLIAITNISSAPAELLNIDFSTNYLRGLLVETTDPPYINTFEYPPVGGGEMFQSYSFNMPIAPGETLTIAFNGRAVLAGDFTGSILVCINSGVNCKTNIVRTIIK
jgi:hypothetical protein